MSERQFYIFSNQKYSKRVRIILYAFIIINIAALFWGIFFDNDLDFGFVANTLYSASLISVAYIAIKDGEYNSNFAVYIFELRGRVKYYRHVPIILITLLFVFGPYYILGGTDLDKYVGKEFSYILVVLAQFYGLLLAPEIAAGLRKKFTSPNGR